jgi:hypothetical protein
MLGRLAEPVLKRWDAAPPRGRALAIGSLALLTLLPLAASLARQKDFTSTQDLVRAQSSRQFAAVLPFPKGGDYGRTQLRTKATRTGIAYGVPFLLSADQVKDRVSISGTPSAFLRVSARADTPARARELAHVAAQQLIAASSREVDRTATAELARGPRREVAFLRRTARDPPSRLALSGRTSKPSLSGLDRAIDRLPGKYPPRPSPIFVLLVGLLLGGGLGFGMLELAARRPTAFSEPISLRDVPIAGWVAVGALALCVLHLVWLARFRWGFVGDWDESGYMSIAFRALEGLKVGGLETLYDVLNDSFGSQPPLVPLSAAPLIALFGHSFDVPLAAEVLWFFALVLATFGLARRLVSDRWAALAALAVSTAPVVSDYTRLFSFAVPAAALLTAALWAILRSHGLLRFRWTAAAGALLGAMLLSRTMTVAFLPGVAIGALVPVALRGDKRRRLAGFGVLCAALIVVAAPWWIPNFGDVRAYLTNTGYGPEALAYGRQSSFFSSGWWTREFRLVADYLYLPLSVALLACFAAAGLSAVRRKPFRAGVAATARRWGLGEPFLLVAVVAEGYLALSSTANAGNAFSLPWIPALVVLAVAAVATAPEPRLRIALAAGLVAASIFNLVAKNGVSGPLDEPRRADLPVIGAVTVTDGRDVMYRGVAASGVPVDPPPARLPGVYRRWLPFDRRLAGFMIGYAEARHHEPFLVPLTGDYILSDTRIVLAAELCCRHQLLTLSSLPGSDTTGSYRRQLRSTGVNFVLTADPQPVQRIRVTRARVERALRQDGFRRVMSTSAPDGRSVALWWRGSGARL